MATVQTSSPKALASLHQSFRTRPKTVLAFFALAAIAVALAVQTIAPFSKSPFSGRLPFFGSSSDTKSEGRGFDPIGQAKSIFAAFAGRSPGERTQAELLLVKKQRREAISRHQAVQRPPQQRALGKVFKPGSVEVPATPDTQVALLSGVPNFPFGPLENASLSDAVGNLPPNLGAPFGPGGGFPGIGFPGGGLPGGNTPGTPTQPPGIGVPPGPSVPPVGELPPAIPPIQPPGPGIPVIDVPGVDTPVIPPIQPPGPGIPGIDLPGVDTPVIPPIQPPGPGVPEIDLPGVDTPVVPPIQPPVPPVPEPDTWMMLLLGFGAIGCAMRRRRDAAAGPAAA